MKTVKNKLEAINYMVVNSGQNYSDIARNAKISRPQIHRWINNEVADVQSDSLYAIADALGYTITHHNNQIEITNQSEGNKEMNMLIKSQQRTIELQEKEIERLEAQADNPTDPLKDIKLIEWENFQAHIVTKTAIHTKSGSLQVGRKILSYDQLDDMAKILGYSTSELKSYWAIGKKFNTMDEHPINEIITKESALSLNSFVVQMRSALDLLKSFIFSDLETFFL